MFPEPISGVHRGKGPVVVLGIFGSTVPVRALAVDGEGVIIEVPVADLNIDWRYDWRAGRWVDVSPYEDDDDEEAADGGGSEVPGDVPGTDGADRGGEG